MSEAKNGVKWGKALAIALGGITWLSVALCSFAFAFLFAGYIG